MRNFKFRVWDGKNMFSSDEIGGFAIDDLSNGLWVETMLFLNYEDKNGTEVFQDDILKINRIDRIGLGKCKYTEYCVAPNYKPWSDVTGEIIDFEIIGNIHQNPKIMTGNISEGDLEF